MRSSTVVIVGSGVIGLSAAYHLARMKFGRVILLDKGPVGDGSSSRSAGITSGLLWTEAGVRARKVGLELFRQLSDELEGYTFHTERGCLNLFPPEMWPEREHLLPLYDRLAVQYEVLTSEEIHRRWPALQPPEHIKGLHDPFGGYSEPSEYISALAKRNSELGVEIHQDEMAVELLQANGRVNGIRTTTRIIEADAVVSTVHVWSLALWKQLGLTLPMKTFIHQRYVTAPFSAPLLAPAVNCNGQPYFGYFRPANGNRILLGVETPEWSEAPVTAMDFQMSSLKIQPSLRQRGIDNLVPILPILRTAAWETEHVGLLSFSMDGEPILGPVSRVPGLFVAGAFHSGGFSYNTVAGLLLAEFVAHGQTSIDISTFSPDRFTDENQVANYLSTGITQGQADSRRH